MTVLGGLQWSLLVPAASAALGALAVLAIDALLGRSDDDARAMGRHGLFLSISATIALVSSVLSGLVFLTAGATSSFDPLLGHFRMDGLAAASIVIIGSFGILVTWLSTTYLMALSLRAGDYYALLLLSLSGAFLAFSADHLLLLFMGLELLALPAHVLAGFDRGRLRSNEAGLKSFLLGAFASALLLYGMALLFGASGRLDFPGVRIALASGSPLASAGLALLLMGIGLRAGIAPFHQWAPDVEEGAPTSVTAFVSVCVRGAALLILLRLVVHGLPEDDPTYRAVFATLAVLGIVIGSLMAIVQRNVKRLIAWAGVAQLGIMGLSFAVGGSAAYGAMLFDLIAVGFATLGVLGILLTLASGGREVERIEDFAGVGRSRPALAALTTLFLMALAGLPVTAGFWAKWVLLQSIVAAGRVELVAIALLGSVLLLFAYMRIPTLLYMRDAPEHETSEASTSELAMLLICAAVTLYLGVFPDAVLPGQSDGLIELLAKLTVSPS